MTGQLLMLLDTEAPLSLDEQIEEIMRSFDFSSVHRLMVFMGWKWEGVDEVTGASQFLPTPYDLRVLARRMLREVAGREGNNTLRRCGFAANKREGHLNLYFIGEQEGNLQ